MVTSTPHVAITIITMIPHTSSVATMPRGTATAKSSAA
jgi:hypothetical protein